MIFNKIIEILKSKTRNKIRIKNNFKKIEKKRSDKLYAIDGGNCLIMDGGTWYLSKIRISCVTYDNGKKIYNKKETETIVLVHNEGLRNNKKTVIAEELNLPEFDFKKIKFEEIIGYVRKYLELKTGLKKLKEMKNGETLLIDGLLACELEENKKIVKKMIEIAQKNKINLVGFAKTTRMLKNGRNYLSIVKNTGDELGLKKWVYALNENEALVKLNENSNRVFRIQYFGDLKNISEILCFYSRDKSILGYPYPLLKADLTARISRREAKSEKNRTILFLKKMGLKEVEQDLLSQDLHKKLDEIAYK